MIPAIVGDAPLAFVTGIFTLIVGIVLFTAHHHFGSITAVVITIFGALTIVRGNHDKKAGDPPECFSARCIDAGEVAGPFVLNHEPGPSRGGYALAGHIHPAVRLSASGEKPLRLPCFWFGARYGVLPAFGAFTGNAEVLPRRGDQVFVIAEQEVLQVA